MTIETFQTTWDKILTSIKNNIGESVFKVWFSHFQPKSYVQGVLKIEVPSKFVKDWLEKKFEQTILKVIKEFAPDIKNIEFIVSTKPSLEASYRRTSVRKITNISQQK